MPELSLAIPFFNEEKNLTAFVNSLIAVFEGNVDYEIIAVDNGSSDKTYTLLQDISSKNERIKVVRIEKNIGYGFGIITGLNAATGKYVGYCWGDGQITAHDTYKVYLKLVTDNLDLCKINRIQRQDSLTRRLSSICYNAIYGILFSINIKDINGCPKIMRMSALKLINPVSRDWFIDAEIVIKAFRKKLKIGEVNVVYHKRMAGSSQVKFSTALEFVKNALIFKIWGLNDNRR